MSNLAKTIIIVLAVVAIFTIVLVAVSVATATTPQTHVVECNTFDGQTQTATVTATVSDYNSYISSFEIHATAINQTAFCSIIAK